MRNFLNLISYSKNKLILIIKDRNLQKELFIDHGFYKNYKKNIILRIAVKHNGDRNNNGYNIKKKKSSI